MENSRTPAHRRLVGATRFRPLPACFSGRIYGVVLLLLGLSSLAGCREDVLTAPPLEHPFTLYGILNPKSDVQAVVVAPVQDRLRPIGADPLDAVVTSTDLTTDETRVWADSIVFDGTAGFSHVYWADFRVAFGHSYRIEAARSDGRRSFAVVNVPPEVPIEVREPGRTTREIRLLGSEFRAIGAIVNYGYVCGDDAYTFSIDYSTRLRKLSDYWTLTVWYEEYATWFGSWCALLSQSDPNTQQDLHAREPASLENDLRKGTSSASLFRVTVDVTIVDKAWRPPTEVLDEPARVPVPIRDVIQHVNPLFDRDALTQPGAMTNVESGFGFVGGGYRQRIELRL